MAGPPNPRRASGRRGALWAALALLLLFTLVDLARGPESVLRGWLVDLGPSAATPGERLIERLVPWR